MTTLPLSPYWVRVTNVYCEVIRDIDYIDYSIWDWLREEYCCERVRIGFSNTGVRFENDSDATAFILRFKE